jgi:hypothetical protein
MCICTCAPVHYVHVGSVQQNVLMFSWWARMHASHYCLSPRNSSFVPSNMYRSRSQWARGLRRRSVAARLLRLWVRIPPETWMSVCCEYCVLSGRGLCDKLITRPEDSYRLWRVVVCDLETSWMRRSWPNGGCRAKNKQTAQHYNRLWNKSFLSKML